MKTMRKAALFLMMGFLLIPVHGDSGQEKTGPDRIKTLASLKKLDDFPLYTMRFHGNYEIPEYAAGGRPSQKTKNGNPQDLSSSWACTCFSARDELGHRLLGRNFDWQNHPALLLFTDPPGRYASVSMVDISYLGYSKSENPEKNPGGLFDAPLIPFDGMNEEGLAVGMMALPAASPTDDPQKQTVGSLMIIRLMLDYAKDVEEALAVIGNFNIDFVGGPPLHYLVTDRSGRSVVVEFIDRKVSVLPNARNWQVATNFVLTGLSAEKARASCWRYNRVWGRLDQAAPFSAANALSLLKDVSQPNTIWSAVYNMSSLDVRIVMGKKYDRVHAFNLRTTVSDR